MPERLESWRTVDTTGVIAAVAAAIAVGLGSLVTWLVARRQSSGRTSTSDAGELWEEGRSIRADMRVEIIGLREELKAARQEAHALREELAASRQESRALRLELATLRRRMAASEDRIDHLEEDQGSHGG